MTIDSIVINFYDHEEGENYTATLSNSLGDDYPDSLDNNDYALKVISIVRKALDEKDSFDEGQ
jgi:hypothetical protein